MHDNYGYFEEDQLGKFGDLSLWRRIVFLGRPYWLGAVLASVYRRCICCW